MSIHSELLLIFSILIGVLLAASGTATALRLRHAGSVTITNLKDRIQAWWVVVVAVGIAALLGPLAITVVFALLAFLALREFLTITAVGVSDRRAALACFVVALPAQFALAASSWRPGFELFIPLGGLIALPFLAALNGNTHNFLARCAEMYFAVILTVYAISHVPALLTVAIPQYEGRQILLVIFLLLIAQASDVLQYVCGKLFGRHALAPALSPSKTVEGLIGGLAGATVLGAGLHWMTPFHTPQAAAVAFAIALSGSAGGLVLSAIKRDRNLKDWSNLVPGHGGVLDRLDSLCFSAPLFFHLTRALCGEA